MDKTLNRLKNACLPRVADFKLAYLFFKINWLLGLQEFVKKKLFLKNGATFYQEYLLLTDVSGGPQFKVKNLE